jgi:hypothetical protein
MAKFGKKPIDPIIRFSSKYIVDEETGCWNWIGNSFRTGYGCFKYNNKNVSAHRFAYEYYNGPLKEGLEICHSCNNKSCVNYKHLRQDTKQSNSYDALLVNNGPSQKLSIDEVIQIKKELMHPYRGQYKDLAHFYKVHEETIGHIKRGTRWSHINIS